MTSLITRRAEMCNLHKGLYVSRGFPPSRKESTRPGFSLATVYLESSFLVTFSQKHALQIFESVVESYGRFPYDRYDRCDGWKKTFSNRCDHMETTLQRSLRNSVIAVKLSASVNADLIIDIIEGHNQDVI